MAGGRSKKSGGQYDKPTATPVEPNRSTVGQILKKKMEVYGRASDTMSNSSGKGKAKPVTPPAGQAPGYKPSTKRRKGNKYGRPMDEPVITDRVSKKYR